MLFLNVFCFITKIIIELIVWFQFQYNLNFCNLAYEDEKFDRSIDSFEPKTNTVKPVYNGPLLSGQFSYSRIFANTNFVFVTCIKFKRSPLLSGHGHPLAVPCLCVFIKFTVLSGHT